MTHSADPATLLAATPLLNFDDAALQALVTQRQWGRLAPYQRIGAVYTFVQNEILFGYNSGDDLPASQVLADGIGQCNTKSTLLMALLRAVGVACRFHGFTINKALQKGAITGLAYALAPRNIIHSWVEVWHEGRWLNLEGFILDGAYLRSLQQRFPAATSFCGYGAATPNLACPPVNWVGEDTYIQKEGINHDYGLFDSPDDFYARHGSNLSGLKRWLYAKGIRHAMNRNVAAVRAGRW
jgi:transglutaminase-like putative cysteine protease